MISLNDLSSREDLHNSGDSQSTNCVRWNSVNSIHVNEHDVQLVTGHLFQCESLDAFED